MWVQQVYTTNIPFSLELCQKVMQEFKREGHQDLSLKKLIYNTSKDTFEYGVVMIIKEYGFVNYWNTGTIEEIRLHNHDSPIIEKIKKYRQIHPLYQGPIDDRKQEQLVKYQILSEDSL